MHKLENFSQKLVAASSGKLAFFVLIIFIIFSATILPSQSVKAEAYAGDAGSPDLSLFYSPDAIYRMAEQFGAQGRLAYINARFTFDLAFPIVYGAFLLTSIAWILGKITPQLSSWRLLVILPVAAVVFDLLENISASIVISRYPAFSPVAAGVAPLFTFIKWLFVGGSFACLFILLIIFLIKQLKK